MAKLLKLRRGTTSQHGSFTGAEGEVTVDTDKETLVVHDGSTAGGHPVAAEDMANVSSASIAGRLSNDSIATSKIAAGALPSDVTVASANIVDGTIVAGDIGTDQINNTHIADKAIQRPMISDNAVNGSKIADSSINSDKILDDSIVNADINASAAIAGTKISPDFGSQNIVTTGTLGTGNGTISSTAPFITFNDTNSESDFQIVNNSGNFQIRDIDQSNRIGFQMGSDGNTLLGGNCTVGGKLFIQDIIAQHTGDSDTFITFSADNTFSVSAGGTTRFSVSDHVDVIGNLDVSAGLDVTGDITVTGTVDGIDIATDVAANTAKVTNATHTGDVTGATSLTIANDVVTFAKMQNITSGHFIARNASGQGDPQQLNAGECRALLNVEDGATADQTGAEIANALNGENIYTTGRFGYDSNDYFQFVDGNRLDLHINGNNEFRFESDGDFHADGDVIAYSTTVASDENLKKDIVTVPDSLAKVEALKGVTFTWKKNDNKSAGVIAQDVQKVLPDAVRTVADFDGNDYLAVNYNALISILIESIKELSAKVKVLEAK